MVIQQLQNLVKLHLYQSKEQLIKVLGRPLQFSDDYIWFYRKHHWLFFRDEISFIFEDDKVVDVCITEYFLWFELYTIFFYEGQTPEYKVIKLF